MAVGIAGAALALSLPSAGFAVSLLGAGAPLSREPSFTSFTPATADPAVARLIASHGEQKAQMMRFTPAGVSAAHERSVTVAVRVDEDAAQALSGNSLLGASRQSDSADGGPHIASTRYNLGLARGYSSFAQTPVAAAEPLNASPSIPDLAEFKPTPGAQQGPSRFAARIQLDEDRRGPRAVAAGQRAESPADQSLDVVGSYRLTRNLNVTAGLRYEQQREHLYAMPDVGPKDSQAVYVGTQFRF